MNPHSHDFVTVDMRGLKAALVARAQAQRVTVSVLVRGAVARELGLAKVAAPRQEAALAGSASSATNIKLSIRLTPDEAKQFAAGARAAGLSRGAYMAGLIADVPVLLRERGVEAEATRQATRGRSHNYDPLWRIKAREDGRLRTSRPSTKSSARAHSTRADAVAAWMEVARVLATSTDKADRDLARSIASFIQEMSSTTPSDVPTRAPTMEPVSKPIDIDLRR